jgi:hypothetical protein
MTIDTTTATERLRMLDPAAGLDSLALPSPTRVLAARRRRASRRARHLGSVGIAAIACGAVALAPPGGHDEGVVARASAALGGPEVLHMVTRAVPDAHHAAGTSETWRAPGGTRRTVVRSADGTLVAELVEGGGVSQSWNAEGNVLYRFRGGHPLADDLELLGQVQAGRADATQLPDATVRVAPTTAGDDAVPARTYFIDEQTNLPVRIAFGDRAVDVLEAQRIPLDHVDPSTLRMSPHPGAEVRDLGDPAHGG